MYHIDENHKQYIILQKILGTVQEILLENEFEPIEVNKITKSMIKYLDKISEQINPDHLLFQNIVELLDDFKQKFDLDIHFISSQKNDR